MKILHLTLKKKWFDMIASGEKKEEYRDGTTYWKKRLDGRDYDVVSCRNGYNKRAPKVVVEFFNCSVGFGKPKWGGDPNNFQYVIRLGEILSTENLD